MPLNRSEQFTGVLECESREKFDNLRHSWAWTLAPLDDVEDEIAEDVAVTRWRIYRAITLQTLMADREVKKQNREDLGEFIGPGEILLDAMTSLSPKPGLLDRMARQEDRLHRRFLRNLEALALIRQLRPGRPGGDVPSAPLPGFCAHEPETIFPQNEPKMDLFPVDSRPPIPIDRPRRCVTIETDGKFHASQKRDLDYSNRYIPLAGGLPRRRAA